MHSSLLLCAVIFLFASPALVASQDDPPPGEPYPYPCLLNHGCQCNHTVVTPNPYDNQYYGTCTSCDKGWLGSFCDEMDLPCLNGGTPLVNATSNETICDCPIAWTGASCRQLQCPNSVGGHGLDHIAPVNALTNMCEQCESGWSGVSCGTCQNNAVCARYAGSDAVCDNSILARGASKHLECEIEHHYAALLCSSHHCAGRVTMDCKSHDETQSFAMSNQGTCAMTFFRVQENASYMDPFFYCTAKNCSLVIRQDAVADSAKNQQNVLGEVIRSIGQTALLLGCAAIALAGQYGRLVLGKHLSNFFVAVVFVVVATLQNGFCFIMMLVMNSDNAVVQNTVAYHCEATSCVCAPDTPYSPQCSTSALSYILPRIQHSIDLACDANSANCVFNPADVQTSIKLTCEASECVSQSQFPYIPTVAGVPAGRAVSQGIDLMTLSIVAAIVVAVLFMIHMYVTFKRTRALSLDFERLFLAGRRVAPSHRSRGPGSIGSEAELRTVLDEQERSQRFIEEEGDPAVDDGRGNYSVINGDEDPLGLPPAVGTPVASSNSNNGPLRMRPTGLQPDDDEYGDDEANDESTLLGSHSPPRNTPYRRLDAVVTDEDPNLALANDGGGGLPGLVRDEVWAAMAAPIELRLDNVSYKLPSNPVGAYFGRLFADQGGETAQEEYQTNLGKQILSDVTFSIRSGELLALMGPSGAGKTTLLDLLAGRLGRNGLVGGTLSINGVPLNTARRRREYRHMVGYVSQEDILLPSLTVRETLWYAARLKLPWPFSAETINHVLDILIDTLKLKQCEHTIVGDGSVESRGISGGEKRRVSIAVELVANPRILFLDEPTSGLDAVSARSVMEAIAQLSNNSRLKRFAPHFFAFQPLVIFSIHQPSADIYRLFDKVLLLSRGIAAYFGDASCAVPAFLSQLDDVRQSEGAAGVSSIPDSLRANTASPSANPAECLMDIEDLLTDDDRVALRLATHQRQNALRAADLVEEGVAFHIGKVVLRLAIDSRRYYPNTWVQMYLLTRRSVTCMMGSFHLVACHALVTLFVGSLMCVLYHAESLDLPGALNRAGSITFLLLVIAFISLSSLEQLIVERKLFATERDNGYYTTFPYIVSKVLVDIVPLRLFFVSILGAVIYFPMGMRTDNGFHYLWFLTIVSCFSVCVTLLTMCIGVLFGTFGASALISSVIFLWNFVFGGLMVQADTIPPLLRLFRFLSPFFLAFESILVNELDGQMCTFAPTDATGEPTGISIPLFCAQYLQNLGLHPNRFGSDLVSLGFMTGFLFLCLWFLTFAFISAKR